MNKITQIQSELKAPKNQFNNFGKYKYRSCEDILEGLKPHLAELELTQTITDDIVLVGERYYVKATVTVKDGAEVLAETTAFAREPINKKGMDESQITGTASSYARKYALNGMWLIDDTKDADTDEHEKQKEASKPKLTPTTVKWKGAVENLAKGKVTLKKIEQHYSLLDKHKNQLQAEARQMGEG